MSWKGGKEVKEMGKDGEKGRTEKNGEKGTGTGDLVLELPLDTMLC